MKIIDLTCPKCGASLQVNSELKTCSCNFCGNQFSIEENERLGYEFEKGRIKAQKEAVTPFVTIFIVILVLAALVGGMLAYDKKERDRIRDELEQELGFSLESD